LKKALSFYISPLNGKPIHEVVDGVMGILIDSGCKVNVLTGGANVSVTQYFLYGDQVNAGFNEVGRVAVP